jgi:hypothetical protein
MDTSHGYLSMLLLMFPPHAPKVIHKMGTTINSVFKQLDEFLESVSVLPKLEQPEKRAEELTLEWEEVSAILLCKIVMQITSVEEVSASLLCNNMMPIRRE